MYTKREATMNTNSYLCMLQEEFGICETMNTPWSNAEHPIGFHFQPITTVSQSVLPVHEPHSPLSPLTIQRASSVFQDFWVVCSTPDALSPRALSPRALSPRALSPRAPSPRAPSPCALSPRALSSNGLRNILKNQALER